MISTSTQAHTTADESCVRDAPTGRAARPLGLPFPHLAELPVLADARERGLSPEGQSFRRESSEPDFTRLLLDRLRTGVVAADPAARVTFVNRLAAETLGRRPAECLGLDLAELFGGEPDLGRALRQVADGGEERVELHYAPPGSRPLEIGATVLRVAEHAPAEMTFVVLFRDLEDRRQLEMEMRRVERLTAVGNMVAGFAREVRKPLAGLQALCEALLMDAGSDGRCEYAIRMLTLVEQLEASVRASLRFDQPEPARRARHRPDAILETALAALTPRWGRRGSPPATRIEGRLPEIDVDAAQIAESLLALIENALDAAGDPSRVELAIRAGAPEGGRDQVRFEVADRGPGIPEGQLSRVFEPFYTTKPQGTGLGLALARMLVRENGGRLSVESTPGQGSRFCLSLPGARR